MPKPKTAEQPMAKLKAVPADPTAEGRFCGSNKKRGGHCERPAGWGTKHLGVGRCKLHGGASPNAEVAGQVQLARREAVVMGAPLDIPPHEAILECIRIAAGEVRYASDRIAELEPHQAAGPVVATHERPMKLEKGGEEPGTTIEEIRREAPALHIWIVARREAMDRLVNYSAAALKAGIQQRLVEIAEGQAQALAEAYREFARRLGHDPSEPKVREAMGESLRLLQGGRAA